MTLQASFRIYNNSRIRFCRPCFCCGYTKFNCPWWRHQMETFSALLAICAGNSPVPGEFPTQRPVTRSFDVYFDLRPNKRLSKQSLGWWFETLSPPLWRHRNAFFGPYFSGLLRWHCGDDCISGAIITMNDLFKTPSSTKSITKCSKNHTKTGNRAWNDIRQQFTERLHDHFLDPITSIYVMVVNVFVEMNGISIMTIYNMN